MRPIDVIKTKIDSDLTKYHGSNLYKISSDSDIKNIRGVGLCAVVSPINQYDENDQTISGEEYRSVVLIINRPGKWMETNISAKYYVLVLSTVQDRMSVSVGFLVSKTIVTDLEIFKSQTDANKQVKSSDGQSLDTMQKDNIQDGKTG